MVFPPPCTPFIFHLESHFIFAPAILPGSPTKHVGKSQVQNKAERSATLHADISFCIRHPHWWKKVVYMCATHGGTGKTVYNVVLSSRTHEISIHHAVYCKRLQSTPYMDTRSTCRQRGVRIEQGHLSKTCSSSSSECRDPRLEAVWIFWIWCSTS